MSPSLSKALFTVPSSGSASSSLTMNTANNQEDRTGTLTPLNNNNSIVHGSLTGKILMRLASREEEIDSRPLFNDQFDLSRHDALPQSYQTNRDEAHLVIGSS
jgi:hypothetical protein